MIRFLDMRRVNAPFEDETIEALRRVVESGRYLHGPETEAFEHELALATGTPMAIGVSNGLDAIRLILRALILNGRLKPGDGVIVPANTYIASVLPITEMGLRPVLVEPDERTLNLDWKLAEGAADRDPGIRAVMAVHLYGSPCWDPVIAPRLMERGLLLVEDNAQAIGATIADGRHTGALGHAAAFSFYPTKNVGALGDAGAVTTADPQLAATIRALANYGSDTRYHNIYRGYNCRLDETQAAILRIRLRSLGRISAERRARAAVMTAILRGHTHVMAPEWHSGAVWHQYVVRVPGGRRDAFRAYMLDRGIQTDIHYAVPPHLQPCYHGLAASPLHITERLAGEYVSLPIASTTLGEAVRIAHTASLFEELLPFAIQHGLAIE